MEGCIPPNWCTCLASHPSSWWREWDCRTSYPSSGASSCSCHRTRDPLSSPSTCTTTDSNWRWWFCSPSRPHWTAPSHWSWWGPYIGRPSGLAGETRMALPACLPVRHDPPGTCTVCSAPNPHWLRRAHQTPDSNLCPAYNHATHRGSPSPPQCNWRWWAGRQNSTHTLPFQGRRTMWPPRTMDPWSCTCHPYIRGRCRLGRSRERPLTCSCCVAFRSPACVYIKTT